MSDLKRLKDKIGESGLKTMYIADRLGLSYQGYWLKLSGKRQFKAGEIGKLKSILNLSDQEVVEIFLAEK